MSQLLTLQFSQIFDGRKISTLQDARRSDCTLFQGSSNEVSYSVSVHFRFHSVTARDVVVVDDSSSILALPRTVESASAI